MPALTDILTKKRMIHPPSFLENNVHYEVIMGSVAYGVSTDTSDMDVYGFCIPPKYVIFPHLNGEIQGFGEQKQKFEQFQQHHIKDESARKEYDVTIYSIVKYFQLCMINNPNMIDSLFVPRRCVIHTTSIGDHVRTNRRMFLHKGSWHRFKGYAYAQINKMKTKNPDKKSKRYKAIQEHGYDVKFAYHIIRLLHEAEQILVEHKLDLERNREQLKSIRRGEWTQEQIIKYAEEKERSLETVYNESTLQHSPNEEQIKTLLLECLEMHYGSLDDAIKTDIPVNTILDDIESSIKKLRMAIS